VNPNAETADFLMKFLREYCWLVFIHNGLNAAKLASPRLTERVVCWVPRWAEKFGVV
jgi:hypothetical protein